MRALLTLLTLALCFLSTFLLAAPANDNFASATPFTGSVQTANTTTATAEPGEPSHSPGSGGGAAIHSVWWKYTPQFTGIYTIDTSGSNFDTVLALYTGNTLPTLTRVAFNDDDGNASTSLLKVFLQKGVTYRIAVDGFTGTVGNVTLHLALTRYISARTYQAVLDFGDKQLDSVGMASFSVAVTGAVTGKFLLGTHTYPFTAALDDVNFTASVVRPGLLPVSITGTFNTTSFALSDGVTAWCTSGAVTCTVRTGGFQQDFLANPSAFGDATLALYFPAAAPYSAANPCPRAGVYHFTTLGGDVGYGVGTLTVGATGLCTASGHMGEGTAFTFSSPLLDNMGQGLTGVGNGGFFTFHVPLYASKGRFTGQGGFDASKTPVALSGTSKWLRPMPPAGTVFLSHGINSPVSLYGSRYTAPAAGHRVDAAFDATSGGMMLTASNYYQPQVTQSVTLGTTNTFTYGAPNANLVKLTLNVPGAAISGTLKFTGATSLTAFTAILIHHPALSAGFYGYVPGAVSYGPVLIK